MTEVLSTHTPALFTAAVARATELLRAGEVVALPTETVYGLAANAFDERAVRRIFEIKGRPAINPVIVHVADLVTARACASEWPALADRLAAAFWPGPLTLVLPRAARVPDVVTAGGATVGIRWPGHPLMQAVIRACGFPLAAPSANLSNQISPTNAEHVREHLAGKIPLIVDGGQAQVGIESTVLDISVEPPRLLRPGMIHAESLLAVTGA
ncbi:MAG TPA: L-threonylcarbamoyladenylate synthase, partial [Verrucomicrobiae bacterium]|nr:L-threonylcarbamoyladenylate synthase [Verrucomicrobiae bacterium]